ncbi:MAG: SGNH/GDSL hydrolase family protein [Bacteroidetes bacterium]|nr:SGNH/GDSL hydrolase family protein [Bacteroidota bacterium]
MELIPSVRNVVAKSKAVFAVVFALSGCGAGPTEPIIADYSILFIGNSLTYTNDLPQTLERLLSYSDHGEVEVESIAHPNYGLEDHWYRGTAGESITKGNWDVVIMQQGPSATEGRPSLLEYSQRFAELIKLGGATPAMFMIWPSASRRSDMFGVSDSYKTAAELTEGLLFPVGEAWTLIWARDSSISLYGSDGFHPSKTGSYLAALVMYQQLANRDPRELPADAAKINLPEEVVRLLQKAAFDANELHARILTSSS